MVVNPNFLANNSTWQSLGANMDRLKMAHQYELDKQARTAPTYDNPYLNRSVNQQGMQNPYMASTLPAYNTGYVNNNWMQPTATYGYPQMPVFTEYNRSSSSYGNSGFYWPSQDNTYGQSYYQPEVMYYPSDNNWAMQMADDYCQKKECLFDYATYKGKDASNEGVSYDNLMKVKGQYKGQVTEEALQFAELMCGNKELFNQVAGKDGRISREEMKAFNQQYFAEIEQASQMQNWMYQAINSNPVYFAPVPYIAPSQPTVFVNNMMVDPNAWVWQTPVTPYSVYPQFGYDNSWVWQEPQRAYSEQPMAYGFMPIDPMMTGYMMQDPYAQYAWGQTPEDQGFGFDPALLGLIDWQGLMQPTSEYPDQSWS